MGRVTHLSIIISYFPGTPWTYKMHQGRPQAHFNIQVQSSTGVLQVLKNLRTQSTLS